MLSKKSSNMIAESEYGQRYLEDTDYFCPNCGKQSVFVENCEGDYYLGPTHYCIECKFEFSMPSGGINESIKFISE